MRQVSKIILLWIGFSFTASATPYDDVLTKLNELADDNATASTYVLGRNDHGIDIVGLRIKGPLATTEETTFLVVGAHHGNERRSVDTAISTAEAILETLADENSPQYARFASTITEVIPVLNIGGYNTNRREEYDADGRSRDPNRDYPDPCGGGPKFNLASTEALARRLIDSDIVGAVTIHGYIGTFTFPWGTYTDHTHTPDHQVYHDVTRSAVQANGYRYGTHADVIYPTNGAFEDWAYHALGIWTSLLEIERGNNTVSDADAILRFLAAIPAERSTYHEHIGNCRAVTESEILSRP